MAIKASVVTVAATATILTADQSDVPPGTSIAIYVPSGGATVYIGDASVTTETGYPLLPGTEHFFDLDPTASPSYSTAAVIHTTSENLYGIVAASTQAVNVIQTGA